MTLRFEFYDHIGRATTLQDDLPSLKRGLKRAALLMSQRSLFRDPSVLAQRELEVNFVSDPLIAQLHHDYLSDPTPTDVMTFPPGELFVSFDTALRESEQRSLPLGEELYRYTLHGFLHLAGYDDQTPTDFEVMHQLQEQLINECYEV